MIAAMSIARPATYMLQGLIALSIALLLVSSERLAVALCGILFVWVTAFPAMLYVQGVDRPPIPFLSFVGAYYGLFFALPIFLTPFAYHFGDRVVLYYRVVLSPLAPQTILLAVLGVALMIAGFYVSKRTIWRRLGPFRLTLSDPGSAVITTLYLVLIIGSIAYRYSGTLQALPSIGQFLDPVGYLGWGGLYLQWRAGRIPRSLFIVLAICLLPLECYWRIRNFFMTDIAFLLLFFAFILWRSRQTKIIAVLGLAGVLVALAYNVTTATRNGPGLLDMKLSRFGEYVGTVLSAQRTPNYPLIDKDGLVVDSVSGDPRITPLIHRIGHIWLFQMVSELSPDPIPYSGGSTYRPLITAFIPRVIYPSKPLENAGAAFGLKYGFTNTPNESTSYNIPWLVELMMNFGPLGVIVGMTLFGLLLGLLEKLFNEDEMTDLEFVIGLTIIFRLGYQESNFSVMTGSLLPLFVALYLYFWLGAEVLTRIFTLLPLRRS